MKKNVLFKSLLSLFTFSISTLFCAAQNTINLAPFNAPFATGYVDTLGKQFSGDLLDISSLPFSQGWGANSGFIVFDAGAIPAGAVIQSATLEIYPTAAATYVWDAGHFAHATSIPVNPINGGKTSREEISQGTVYADKLEWGVTMEGPITSALTVEGLAALQKKIGTAFSMGIDPPDSTSIARSIAGYNTTHPVAQKPVLRVTYIVAAPSKPTADFTVNTRDTFLQKEVRFYDNSGNYPTSWSWDFGDGGTSANQNPVHAYADTGSYTIKLVAKNAQGEDVMAKEKFVHVGFQPAPIAGFSIDDVEETTVSFLDTSANLPDSWNWDFGDGTTDTVQNPVHTFPASGVYAVKLVVGNDGGVDSITQDVTVELLGLQNQNIDQAGMFVYPNPLKNMCYVKGIAEGYYKVSTVLGGQVLQLTRLAPDGRVDLSSLPAGLYVLQVYNKHINYCRKIRKEW